MVGSVERGNGGKAVSLRDYSPVSPLIRPKVLVDLTIFAIQKVLHRFASSFVSFFARAAFIGVLSTLGDRTAGFLNAAIWAAIRETGLIRLQLKLFRADGTDSDWVSHISSILSKVFRPSHLVDIRMPPHKE